MTTVFEDSPKFSGMSRDYARVMVIEDRVIIRAIDEMAELVSYGLVSPEMAKEFAIKMYDAGYRKVKP